MAERARAGHEQSGNADVALPNIMRPAKQGKSYPGALRATPGRTRLAEMWHDLLGEHFHVMDLAVEITGLSA